MSNRIEVHLDKCDRIKVCENLECDKECTPIKLGDDATIFANHGHLEEFFEELDKKLHIDTYSDLEDKIFTLNDELDTANDRIETLEEIMRGE